MIEIRRLDAADSLEELTALLHAAYAELGAMGLNYTAVDQSTQVTRERVEAGTCFVAMDGATIVGTLVVEPPKARAACPYFAHPHVASAHQLAVLPSRRRAGIGSRLLERAEAWALDHGYSELALDTAEPAHHLIALYERRGYERVGFVQWKGKRYRSVLLAKKLGRAASDEPPSLELVVPRLDLVDSYRAMVRELAERGEKPIPFTLGFPTESASELIERLAACSRGEGIPETFVPHSTFWLVRDASEVVGVSNLRHRLTDALRRNGGSIGYGIRPTRRREGLARVLLRRTLERARGMGLAEAILTCAQANVASVRTIEACGGELVSEEYIEARGEVVRCYRITLEDLRLEPFRAEHTKELVSMWRESFEHGVGITDPHPIEEQERYLFTELVPSHAIRVALLGGRIVGFVAATPSSIAQLYVRKGFHRRGIGSRLLEWAKARSAGSLWLYTFERNAGARAFYEHHGFTVAARGHEPDWKLDDLRYEWSAAQPKPAK